MNWYKYWYFTIYFIYDHFSKNTEDNKIYSIGFFTWIIYMLFAILICLVNSLIDFNFIKYIDHPYSHLIFILIIYLINSFLFEKQTNARAERMVYKGIRTQKRNIYLTLLTIGVIIAFCFNLIFLKKYLFFI